MSRPKSSEKLCKFIHNDEILSGQRRFICHFPLYDKADVNGTLARGIALCCDFYSKTRHTRALKCFQKALNEDQDKAAYCLGVCHMYGWGVSPDAEQAIQFWRQSNDSYAFFALAECYEHGISVSQNIKTALELYQRASDAGNLRAANRLEYCDASSNKLAQMAFSQQQNNAMDRSSDANSNEKQSLQLSEVSCCSNAAMDAIQAWIRFEQLGVELQDDALAMQVFLTAAESGNVYAQLNVGTCYFYGIVGEICYAKAVLWLTKAAESNAQAQYRLGMCFEQGLGTVKNIERALELYELAANAGHAAAQFRIGAIYCGEADAPRSPELAIKWLQLSAAQNNMHAAELLADCYYSGQGVDENTSAAIQLYQNAARAGSVAALFKLGLFYLQECNAIKNGNYAANVFQTLANCGCSTGLRLLADIYYKNRKNTTAALGILQIAAENGDSTAQWRIARHFTQQGNQVLAAKWAAESAQQGHTSAIADCEKMQANGIFIDRDIIHTFRICLAFSNTESTTEFCEQQNADTLTQISEQERAFRWFRHQQSKLQLTRFDDRSAIICLLEYAAHSGCTEAQCFLAQCLLEGRYVDRDNAKSVEWLQEAAEMQNARASLLLGHCLLHGNGITRNKNLAFNAYLCAAEMSNPDAMLAVGLCYRDGDGVEQDLDAAITWFSKAAECNNIEAVVQLALSLQSSSAALKNERRIFDLLTKAAGSGNSNAQFHIANCYLNGKGILKNRVIATYWLSLAAQQENTEAQLSLGHCYEYGIGIQKNVHEAFKLYEEAAANGNVIAQYLAGRCCCAGNGIKYNRTRAFEYFTQVADTTNQHQVNISTTETSLSFESMLDILLQAGRAGCDFVERDIGDCYYYGIGAAQSYKEAVWWYEKAAVQGDVEAACQLAYCYANRFQVPNDSKDVFRWYTMAAKHNNPTVLYALASCYLYGYGTVADLSKASEWYQKAWLLMPPHDDQNNASTVVDAAQRYYLGCGVEKNPQKAIELFVLAAEAGNADAMFSLACHYKVNNATKANQEKAFEYCLKAANKNHASAMYCLGEYYYYGRLVSCDYKAAITWYVRAAEAGNLDAVHSLGYCYGKCFGVDNQIADMFTRLTANANTADVNAQFLIGYCCHHAIGCSQNYDQAFEWYRKAAYNGNPNAMKELGDWYLDGRAVCLADPRDDYWAVKFNKTVDRSQPNKNTGPRDYSQAFEWYRKAAAGWSTEAMRQLTYCFAHGYGVSKSQAQADRWNNCAELINVRKEQHLQRHYTCPSSLQILRQSAEQNVRDLVALILQLKHHVPVLGYGSDQIRQFQIYRFAAELGDSDAQFELGKCYKSGWGIPKSIQNANMWREIAAKNGCEKAILFRADSFFYGRETDQDFESAAIWYKRVRNPSSSSLINLARCLENSVITESKQEAAEVYLNASTALSAEIAALDLLND